MEQERPKKPNNKRAKPRVTCGQSGGMSRQRGMPCDNPPTIGRTRCRFHGGHAKRGVEHPRYKFGSLSAVLPSPLAKKLERVASDPDLYDLRQDIALVSLREQELLSQLHSTSTSRSKSLVESYNAVEVAIKSGDAEIFMPALQGLRALIMDGRKEDDLWDKIEKTIERRVRTIESERRWLLDSDQMITAERLAVLGTEIVNTIKALIDDYTIPRENLCEAISNDFRIMLNHIGRETGNGVVWSHSNADNEGSLSQGRGT